MAAAPLQNDPAFDRAQALLPKRAAALQASADYDAGRPWRCCRVKADGTTCGSRELADQPVEYALLQRVFVCGGCKAAIAAENAELRAALRAARLDTAAVVDHIRAAEGGAYVDRLMTPAEKLVACQRRRAVEEAAEWDRTPRLQRLVDAHPRGATFEEFKRLAEAVAPGFHDHPISAEEPESAGMVRELLRRLAARGD